MRIPPCVSGSKLQAQVILPCVTLGISLIAAKLLYTGIPWMTHVARPYELRFFDARQVYQRKTALSISSRDDQK
jgi:hypothetical protein